MSVWWRYHQLKLLLLLFLRLHQRVCRHVHLVWLLKALDLWIFLPIAYPKYDPYKIGFAYGFPYSSYHSGKAQPHFYTFHFESLPWKYQTFLALILGKAPRHLVHENQRHLLGVQKWNLQQKPHNIPIGCSNLRKRK